MTTIRQPANQHPERVDSDMGDTDLAFDMSVKLQHYSGQRKLKRRVEKDINPHQLTTRI